MHARATLHRLAALASLLVLLAPLWLGPALSPLARALGGPLDHPCACGMSAGMSAGHCDCPECNDRGPHAYPTCKSSCDDAASPLPAAGPLACVLPREIVLGPPPPAPFVSPLVPSADSLDRLGPPTPPPRQLRV